MSEPKSLPIVEASSCCSPAPKAAESSCCSTEAAASSCCGGSAKGEGHAASEASAAIDSTSDVRVIVRERYGAVAQGRSEVAGCCAGPVDAVAAMLANGYTEADAANIPEGSNLGLGCGNPIAFAAILPGETVLDLGSGAGIDCFLAAREVGPTGHVIGVDMTAAMIERARVNAKKIEVSNVEFRLGEIEHLPVADRSVDVVISNCVVNLSPDKPQVFRDAFRALRPGGRMLVSDLVLTRDLNEEARRNVALYVGCVAGAERREAYLAQMEAAGFVEVEVVNATQYTIGVDQLEAGSMEREAFDAVLSIKVRARKP